MSLAPKSWGPATIGGPGPRYGSARGEYQTVTRDHYNIWVGEFPRVETMTLLLCVRQLASQQGTYWVVRDSESAVGALRTYQEGGKCGDGIHHLYAQTLGVGRLSSRAAINMVVTLSHWITSISVRVDAATREEPQADLT